MSLMTLTEIAKVLDVPESTLRFRRRKYTQYIPTVGEGRATRYPSDAVDVFRMIDQMLDTYKTDAEIEAALQMKFGVVISDETQRNNNAAIIRKEMIADAIRDALEPVLEAQNVELNRQMDAMRREMEGLRVEMARIAETAKTKPRRGLFSFFRRE